MKEKNFSQLTIQLIILLSCLFILTSCSLENYVNITQTPPNKDLFNATLAIDAVKTQTITPNEIRSTATPKATVTLRPMKTITNDEVVQLIQKDWKCTEPCWLGIRPNNLTWEEARIYLDNLGISKFSSQQLPGGFVQKYNRLDVKKESIYIEQVINVKEDMVKTITVNVDGHVNPSYFKELMGDWSPQNIIKKYGKPDFLQIGLFFGGEYSPKVSTSILFIYKDRGLSIEFAGAAWDGSNIIICPGFKNSMNLINGMWIRIFDSKITPDLVVKAEGSEVDLDLYKNYSEVTGQTIDDFSKRILYSEDFCFSAKRSNWIP
jgi:hypothetical protein